MNIAAEYQVPGFGGNWMWYFAGRQSKSYLEHLKNTTCCKIVCTAQLWISDSPHSSDRLKYFRTPTTKYCITGPNYFYTAEAVEKICLVLKLFIKMCIACRYFIVWLQQLSPHLLACSQRDQAKCCSHISKCDDYSSLATLDQTWFHLCCKCHFKWLSVCRSSPCWHIQKLDIPLSTSPILYFLPYIPVFTTVSLWIRSSASHQSSIYYRHLFLNNLSYL